MAGKQGGSKKKRRSAKDKPYYNNYRTRYSGKLIRRRGKRDKQIAFFTVNPTEGSPSQIVMRRKNNNRKLRNEKKKQRGEEAKDSKASVA